MQTAAQHDSVRTRQNVRTIQNEQCYRQLPISLVVNLINGAILVAVLWGAIEPSQMLTWSLLLLAVTFARFLSLRAFHRNRERHYDHDTWKRFFVIGAGASGIVWGSTGILLFDPVSFPNQVFLAFVLGGMAAGAIPVLSSADHAYQYFALPSMLPICIQMFAVGDRVHLIMGLMITIFTSAMLASSLQVRRLFRDSLDLRNRLFSSLQAEQALEQMVRLDALTQIPNRRRFEEELEKEWRRAKRDRECLSVIAADIDHFKDYNDRYGHPAGDRCLIAVAQTLQNSLYRPGDVVARIGGEEFAFLLPNTTSDGALVLAESIRQRILDANLPHAASPVASRVTLSFGIASSDLAAIDSPSALVHAADNALYEAKRRGRNRIASAGDSTSTTTGATNARQDEPKTAP